MWYNQNYIHTYKVKHIIQSPNEAYNILGWKALIELDDGIVDVL